MEGVIGPLALLAIPLTYVVVSFIFNLEITLFKKKNLDAN